jgi:hypothetical protein
VAVAVEDVPVVESAGNGPVSPKPGPPLQKLPGLNAGPLFQRLPREAIRRDDPPRINVEIGCERECSGDEGSVDRDLSLDIGSRRDLHRLPLTTGCRHEPETVLGIEILTGQPDVAEGDDYATGTELSLGEGPTARPLDPRLG